jgi:lipoic acid synthetase
MKQPSHTTVLGKKPAWLKRRLPSGPAYEKIKAMVRSNELHTVCREAMCPNIWECYSSHTATFLIMGSKCTRNCGFCSVSHGPVDLPDPDEPCRVARAASNMGLKYVVITSVTRDDLVDGGAVFFVRTIEEIRKRICEAKVEVLIPDFQGNTRALKTVVAARPDVLNHNIETVPRLYPTVRPQANYHQSLKLLEHAKQYDPFMPTKSGLMLGLGESRDELNETLKDLRKVGCQMLTLGQYLQPTQNHLPVVRYVRPEEFEMIKSDAFKMGFTHVASGPFVRSSYHAKEFFD